MINLDNHPILRWFLIVALNIGFIAAASWWKGRGHSSNAASSGGDSVYGGRSSGHGSPGFGGGRRLKKPRAKAPGLSPQGPTAALPADPKSGRERSALAGSLPESLKPPKNVLESPEKGSVSTAEVGILLDALAKTAAPAWLIPGAAEFMLGQTYGSRQRSQTRFQLVLISCRGRVCQAADGSWQITDVESEC